MHREDLLVLVPKDVDPYAVLLLYPFVVLGFHRELDAMVVQFLDVLSIASLDSLWVLLSRGCRYLL